MFYSYYQRDNVDQKKTFQTEIIILMCVYAIYQRKLISTSLCFQGNELILVQTIFAPYNTFKKVLYDAKIKIIFPSSKERLS